MPTIGIIDDRADQRDTLVRQIDLTIRDENEWETLGIPPLKDKTDYLSWIAENDVSVLILDERLNEATQPGTLAVDYVGHEIVDFIRERYDTIPIWVVTAFPDDEDLKKRFPDVEDIIERTDFALRRSEFVPRMVRAGTKFYREHREELERLSELSSKIARGIATPDEIQEAGGLQLKQTLPFESLIIRNDWLEKLEQTVSDLEDLERRIVEHLGSQENDEMV